MNTTKLKDLILKHLIKNSDQPPKRVEKIFNELKIEIKSSEMFLITKSIHDDGYLTYKNAGGHRYSINGKGFDFSNNGGYSESDKIDKIKKETILFEHQITKLQAKTKYLPYLLSIISLIISIITYFSKS